MDLLAEYRLATLYFEAGDPTAAARLLEPIIEAEPDNASVRQLLARAYFQSAQLSRAEEQLRTLVDQDPSDHYSHHVLGRTLERLNRHADALRHLRIAAAMHSANDDYATALRRVETRVSGGR
ncbi:tetratricopeptide repeat protein [Micromonospora krabiensis]|uniref:Tetratricopeptide repeat-containing protein n=1 Tax=Micromonospora krabiensis TaxID=307121 RepID=A0A1C3NA54_9ACTN|nr:tetratricopeptide repeat protein [Micromonospora krabiensis]SBV29450.1 Tetratricopeptide repeat-containing protein [Micromonospora krabiensis]